MITVDNIKSKIYVFGRKGKKPYIKEVNFKPYFYAEDENGEYITIEGKKCKKIFVNEPSEIPIVRKKYIHYEADIVYRNRYLIDTYFNKEIPAEELRKCYFDIEVETTDGLPDNQNPQNRIISIVCYDTFLGKYVNFAISPNSKAVKKSNGISYYWFDNEVDMLNEFLSFIQSTDPDIIIGWNSDAFDIPYLINRLNTLKLDSSKLARCGVHPFSKKDNDRDYTNKVFGRVLLDEMKMYKKLSQGERERYSLDYISRYELGIEGGKEAFDKKLYEKDFEQFIKYNIRDVELLKLLDEKLKLVEYFDSIRRYAKCLFEDVFQNSKVNDSLILCFCKDKFVVPSKSHNKKEYVEGALILQPKKGIIDNVAVFDMKSLYPSIIYSFNISYETYLCNAIEGCINVDNKFYYKKSPQGLLPTIIIKLIEERDRYKKLRDSQPRNSIEYNSYDSQQTAIKVIANSLYGTLGLVTFRLFKKECFETVTYIGRRIIKEAIKIAEQEGYEVLYGDTDSIFVKMDDRGIEGMKELKTKINNHWSEFLKQFNVDNHILQIQFEKVFRSIFFTGVKKRYVGKLIMKDNEEVDKLLVMGFESKRSDMPEVGRIFQRDLFNLILEKAPKSQVIAFVNEFKRRIREEFSPEQIALPLSISKNFYDYKNVPIHIRAVSNANRYHNANFTSGDKARYIFIKKEKAKCNDNVIAFKDKLWDGYVVDYDKMIQRIVDNKVDTIFEALGWNEKSKSILDFM